MKIAESQISRLQIIAEQFRAEIFACIRSKVRTLAIAEDLTQETFVKVGRALAKGATPEHFRGWLYQLPETRLSIFLWSPGGLCRWKIRLNRKAINSEAPDPDDGDFCKNLFSYTLNVIDTFPVEDREVLVLTEIDGLSREELAAELKISLTAAKSRVHRARAKLRKAIEKCCRLVTDPYGRVIDWQNRRSPPCGPKKSATQPGIRR